MSGPDGGDRSAAFTSDSVPEEYERYLVPAVFAPWAEVLLDAVVIAPGSRVLDIASGTGVVARAATRRAGGEGRVVASDVSGPMLARSAAVRAPSGAAPIEYREAPADALPFEEGCFDVVLCQQGLQFFPTRAAAIGEIRRVLRPGGVAERVCHRVAPPVLHSAWHGHARFGRRLVLPTTEFVAKELRACSVRGDPLLRSGF